MIDAATMHREFPLVEEWAYFATASNGILPERSRLYLERYFAEHHYLELERHYRMFADLAVIRERAARLFGGAARNWALLPNTGHGLATAAEAIDWREGDNVVLADCEFPANVGPWQNLAARGVDINWVAAGTERKARAEALMAACDDRTRALSVSGVQFMNGYAPDLPALSAHCRERGIWFCVDGIQGLGNRAWNLPELGVDFLAAGGQKWLCSPRGSGLFYLSDRAVDALDGGELRQTLRGWLDTETWQFTDLLDFDRPLTTDARRLEVGTCAFHDLICLGKSLELLEELELDAVAAHSDSLLADFLAGLEGRGLLAQSGGPFAPSCSDDPAARRSQTLALGCPDARAAWRFLAERKIAVSPREGGIRIAFHHYNTRDNLERLLDGLTELVERS
jgi:cysteine desulfurase / selenocysteine lyase